MYKSAGISNVGFKDVYINDNGFFWPGEVSMKWYISIFPFMGHAKGIQKVSSLKKKFSYFSVFTLISVLYYFLLLALGLFWPSRFLR